MILNLLIMINLILNILISIAFFTLLERKILGYIQIRKGPNKISVMGILQPFSDAIKLFFKENSLIIKSNYLYYLMSPMFNMLLMLMLWYNIPLFNNMMIYKFNFLFILCILSMGVFGLMMAGWSSNSLYSLIGSLRSIAQTISYEVSMIIIMLSFIFLIESYNMKYFMKYQYYSSFFFLNIMISYIFMVSFLAELNRTPFDFSESESELVSGFNTEYMSGSFALIFMGEYGMMLLMMLIINIFFFGNMLSNFFWLIYLMLLYLILWIRGTFPRFRYDNLMYLSWFSFLPISLNYLIFIFSIKFILLM